MSTKQADEYSLDSMEFSDPVGNMISNIFFVMAAVFMCLAEMQGIRSLWLRHAMASDSLAKFSIPFVIFVPGFLGLAMRVTIGKMEKEGKISLPAAPKLEFSLGILMMITYVAILELAEKMSG